MDMDGLDTDGNKKEYPMETTGNEATLNQR